MASRNLFDLLDDDTDDAYAVIAAAQEKLASSAPPPAAVKKKTTAPAAKKKTTAPAAAYNATKPFYTGQPVIQSRDEGGRGRGGRPYSGSRGNYSKGKGSLPGEQRPEAENTFAFDVVSKKSTERSGPDVYGDYHGRYGPPGGRRGGFNNGDATEEERPQRRFHDRRSGTGRGSEFKRNGAGRGNWGSTTDEIVQVIEEPVAEIDAAEKPVGGEENADAEKEIAVKEPEVQEAEEKEPEEKQMTLEEYEKVLEEKRRALLSLTGEETKGVERKVDVEEFQSMQLVSKKKNDDEVFIKLGSDKDKRKEAAEREERARKSVNINEFLKNAGRGYGGRANGRGRGDNRGREGYSMNYASSPSPAPAIEDRSQFPGLGVAV